MNEAGLALEERPGNEESLRRVRRAVHTLKGDSAACGFRELSELAHELEDVLTPELARENTGLIPEVVLAAADTFHEMLAAYRDHLQLPAGGALREHIQRLLPKPSQLKSWPRRKERGIACESIPLPAGLISRLRSGRQARAPCRIQDGWPESFPRPRRPCGPARTPPRAAAIPDRDAARYDKRFPNCEWPRQSAAVRTRSIRISPLWRVCAPRTQVFAGAAGYARGAHPPREVADDRDRPPAFREKCPPLPAPLRE
ncbi:MAG: Hpt domain-containing protein [Candidatus Binataceae bacterium]